MRGIRFREMGGCRAAASGAGAPEPTWPTYDEAARRTLVFDRIDRVESDPRRSKRLAWEEFVPHV